MRNWLKTVLFLSVFSPALIILAITKYLSSADIQEVAPLAIIGALGTCLTILILRLIKQNGETLPFIAKKLKSNDAFMLAILTAYFFL